jgi:hypothetical protein
MRHPQAQWISYAPHGQAAQVACDVCRVGGTVPREQVEAFLAQHLQHHASVSHYGLGDAVAALTKFFGIRPCTPCEQRRRALNQVAPRLWTR